MGLEPRLVPLALGLHVIVRFRLSFLSLLFLPGAFLLPDAPGCILDGLSVGEVRRFGLGGILEGAPFIR
jgi:hypothetical protein